MTLSNIRGWPGPLARMSKNTQQNVNPLKTVALKRRLLTLVLGGVVASAFRADFNGTASAQSWPLYNWCAYIYCHDGTHYPGGCNISTIDDLGDESCAPQDEYYSNAYCKTDHFQYDGPCPDPGSCTLSSVTTAINTYACVKIFLGTVWHYTCVQTGSTTMERVVCGDVLWT
jgi:hypothetical protein